MIRDDIIEDGVRWHHMIWYGMVWRVEDAPLQIMFRV